MLTVQEGGTACISLVNLTGFTQTTDSGTSLGTVAEVAEEIQFTREDEPSMASAKVSQVINTSKAAERQQKLAKILTIGDPGLQELLMDYHHLFSVEEEERGETDLVQLSIDTGDALPIKQQARRIPYAASQEVAQHLRKMQEANVIQPSSSPWSSPIVSEKERWDPALLHRLPKTQQCN